MMEKTVELKVSSKKKKLFKVTFLKDLKGEFKKISWTPKQELFQCTKIVVFSVFTFGFGIYFVDLIIQGGLSWLDFLVHRIFG